MVISLQCEVYSENKILRHRVTSVIHTTIFGVQSSIAGQIVKVIGREIEPNPTYLDPVKQRRGKVVAQSHLTDCQEISFFPIERASTICSCVERVTLVAFTAPVHSWHIGYVTLFPPSPIHFSLRGVAIAIQVPFHKLHRPVEDAVPGRIIRSDVKIEVFVADRKSTRLN